MAKTSPTASFTPAELQARAVQLENDQAALFLVCRASKIEEAAAKAVAAGSPGNEGARHARIAAYRNAARLVLAERARLTDEWFQAHSHEWDAYNALPLAERAANLEKIEAALTSGGPLAGRAMAQAIGMPSLPDELCDPINVLEARMTDDDAPIRETAAQLGLSPAEVEEVLNSTSDVRMDH